MRGLTHFRQLAAQNKMVSIPTDKQTNQNMVLILRVHCFHACLTSCCSECQIALTLLWHLKMLQKIYFLPCSSATGFEFGQLSQKWVTFLPLAFQCCLVTIMQYNTWRSCMLAFYSILLDEWFTACDDCVENCLPNGKMCHECM